VIDELALVHVLLGAIALISCLSVANKRTIRTMPRSLWVATILLVPVAGPVAWFLAGRPYPLTRSRRWPCRRFPDPPPAPDDDADFLRSLDQITNVSDSGRADPPGTRSQKDDPTPDRHEQDRQD
jgi:hypothetical protein